MRTVRAIVATVALSLFIAPSVSVQAQDMAAAIQARYEKLGSFTADFEQTLTHKESGSVEKRQGKLLFKKPLLIRLQTPLLRLQLVKRLAEISGFSQGEVERLCDLRPVARSTPARAARPKPSLLRQLLRVLLQKPELAAHVPVAALPRLSDEARVIESLCALVAANGDVVPEYASLLERLRGAEDETLLSEVAAELMQQPFAEDDIDAVFYGAVERLLEKQRLQDFGTLQEKVARLGVAGLSSEEKATYLQALRGRMS